MMILRVAGMAILFACVAAGIVWFGWGLAANLIAVRRARSASTAAAGETPAAAAERS